MIDQILDYMNVRSKLEGKKKKDTTIYKSYFKVITMLW